MSDVEAGGGRFETVLVLVLYVLPLTATVAFLAWVELPGLALALLAIEAAVSAAVVQAKAPEGSGRLRPPVIGLGVVAVVAGAGAAALLSGV